MMATLASQMNLLQAHFDKVYLFEKLLSVVLS